MRSIFNKKSVFTKLLATYSVMSIITSLFIGVVSYEASTRLYERQIENDSRLLLEQYRALIETDLMIPVKKMVMELLVNNEYRDINNFFQDDVDYGELYWYDKEISECLMGDRYNYIRDIFLHDISNELVLSAEEGIRFLETRDHFWWALENFQEQNDKAGWSVQWYENTIYALRYCQKYPIAEAAPISGYIVADVKVESLLELMESLSAYQDGELVLLDEEGKLIPIAGMQFQEILSDGMNLSHKNGGVLMSVGREEYYLTYSSPFGDGWRLAMLTPVTEFYASSLFVQRLISVLTVLCIVVGFIFSIYFSRNIYSPVEKLIGKLQRRDKRQGILIGNEYEFIDREILHLTDTVQELNGMLKSYSPMIEYNILSGLVSKTVQDRDILQQRMGLIGLEQQKPYATAMVIKIRNLLIDIMDEKNLQIFKVHIIGLVKGICGEQCIISEYKEDEILAMILHEKNDIRIIVDEVERKCSVNPMGSLSIGVGSSYEDPVSLGNSYSEAKEALQYSYFNDEKILYEYNEFTALENPEDDILGKCNKEFEKAIKSGNLEGALELINHIEQTVKKLPYKYEYMDRKLLDMVGVFARYCRDVNIKSEVENIEDRFLNADRLGDFLITFREMVSDVIGRQILDSKNRNENLAKEVCDFIDIHLSDDISINSIAERLAVSEGHLSRLFKKMTGKSVVEYITEKRMEEAKRLLTETSMNIEKIANLSGYRTPHYFGQKFKETYGYTPTQYRELFRGQLEE